MVWTVLSRLLYLLTVLLAIQDSILFPSHQPPAQLVVWNRPYKGQYLHARRAGVTSLYYLLPLKSGLFFLRLIILFLDILLYCFFCYIPHCSNIISSGPKALFHLFCTSGCLSKIIRALFPFKYPINSDTLIFGGMLTQRCTWSGHTAPSIISTPL